MAVPAKVRALQVGQQALVFAEGRAVLHQGVKGGDEVLQVRDFLAFFGGGGCLLLEQLNAFVGRLQRGSGAGEQTFLQGNALQLLLFAAFVLAILREGDGQ